jgi:nucleoside phosphorylase
VGVLAAMPIELRPFAKALSLQREPWVDRSSVWRGRVGSTAVTAGITGIGPARAMETTRRLLGSFAVDLVVMIGVAGGLDPSLGIGDLVVPESVLDGATGRHYRPTTPVGHTPAGVLHTSATIVHDDAEFDRLRAAGVVALDMETAGVGAVCEAEHRPWYVFRAVSDRVADGIVDQSSLAMTRPDGSADLGAVARLVLRRPRVLGQLVKLGRDTARATAAISGAAVAECRRS